HQSLHLAGEVATQRRIAATDYHKAIAHSTCRFPQVAPDGGIEGLRCSEGQTARIGQEKTRRQVIRQLGAQGVYGPLRKDWYAVHSLRARGVVIQHHHFLRPGAARRTDGRTRIIWPDWWQAVEDVIQPQTHWAHAEILSQWL